MVNITLKIFYDFIKGTNIFLKKIMQFYCHHQEHTPKRHLFNVSSPGSTDIWGHIILCCGGCLVHCVIFSSISGLYPLDAISTLTPVVTTKTIFQHYQVSPGVQNKNCWLYTYFSMSISFRSHSLTCSSKPSRNLTSALKVSLANPARWTFAFELLLMLLKCWHLIWFIVVIYFMCIILSL